MPVAGGNGNDRSDNRLDPLRGPHFGCPSIPLGKLSLILLGAAAVVLVIFIISALFFGA